MKLFLVGMLNNRSFHIGNKYILFLIFFIYGFSAWLFSGYDVINNYFYFRLISPSSIILLGIIIAYKALLIIEASSNYAKYKRIGIIIILLTIFFFFISSIRLPRLQFDTWNIYDVSKHIFVDFGRADMLRQHIYNTPYQIAFPPLFPILMAILNYCFNYGVLASVFINFIVCILIVYYTLAIGSHIKNVYLSIIILVLLFLNPRMISCWTGGSTIPLGILLYIITSYEILKTRIVYNYKSISFIAFLSGIGVLNRFDYLPIALVLGFLLTISNKYGKGKILLSYYPIFMFFISPWIIYSMIHFNSLFITDNARRLYNILDTRPSTFFSPSNPAQTIFNDPISWGIGFSKRILSAILAFYVFLSKYTWIREIILSILLSIFILPKKFLKKLIVSTVITKSIMKRMSILLLPLVFQAIIIIITGYPDQRYYILLLIYINYVCIYFLNLHINLNNIKIFCKKSYIIIFLTIVIVVPKTEFEIEKNLYLTFTSILSENKASTTFKLIESNELHDFLKNQDNPRLIINRSEPSIDIAKFTALCEEVTTLSPTNLSKDNVNEFVNFFNFNFLYSSDITQVDIFRNCMTVTHTGVDNLYQLDSKYDLR